MDKAVEQLMLIGGTAMLYPPGSDERQRRAAFDSILYAQMVANKNVGSRFDDYPGWYNAYREVYRQLGWIKLASTHDLKQLGQPSPGAPIQPLEAWLKIRSLQPDSVLAAVRAGLGRSSEGVRHLLKFTARGAELVLELGLLRPGPVLDLCSITWQSDRPIADIPQQLLQSGQALRGQAEFNGVSLALDNARFQHQREELQALMKSKDAQGEYRFDPYAAARSTP